MPSSYDEVPYMSGATSEASPDRIAVVGAAFGVEHAPPERCRVLEIGAATCSNLLPLAGWWPDCELVAVERSPVQVARARERIAAAGVTNLRVVEGDLQDVADLGTFDYVIAHGVYSWVPVPVRLELLGLIRRSLAPNGLGYVSYNCNPGFAMRRAIREMMQFHVQHLASPDKRIEQARALLDFLAENTEPVSAHGIFLRKEAIMIQGQPDWYVFHDHLEDHNHGLWLHEFVDELGDHGLQYVGDTRIPTMFPERFEQGAGVIRRLASDQVSMEQYTDFLSFRAFRTSVVCRDTVALDRNIGPKVWPRLRYALDVAHEGDLDLEEGVEVQIGTGKQAMETSAPAIKAALAHLVRTRPAASSLDELVEAVRDLGIEPDASDIGLAMFTGAMVTAVRMHVAPDPFTCEVGQRPRVPPTARVEASEGKVVTNGGHQGIRLNPLESALVRYADGTRDREALIDALVAEVRAGDLGVPDDEQHRLADPEDFRAWIGEGVDEELAVLVERRLMVG